MQKSNVNRLLVVQLSAVLESDGSGEKMFLSLVVLHFTLLYLRPERKSVNSPYWGWVGSLMMEVVVDALQRGDWSPDDPLGCLYHSLQAFAVHDSGTAVPHGDATGQDALNNAAVEIPEDLSRHAKLPEPPQKIQPLLSLLHQLCGVHCPGEVLADVHPQVFEGAHPLHRKLSDE